MKLSIATVCISGTLSQKLDAIAKAGFDGIEIFEQDFMTHHLSASDVGKLIEITVWKSRYFSHLEISKHCLSHCAVKPLIEQNANSIS